MLSVDMYMCADVKQCDTNRNRCTQTLVVLITNQNENSSADEIPGRDVTHLLSVYLFTRTTHPVPEHFSK